MCGCRLNANGNSRQHCCYGVKPALESESPHKLRNTGIRYSQKIHSRWDRQVNKRRRHQTKAARIPAVAETQVNGMLLILLVRD
jgi:hypothetical protein